MQVYTIEYGRENAHPFYSVIPEHDRIIGLFSKPLESGPRTEEVETLRILLDKVRNRLQQRVKSRIDSGQVLDRDNRFKRVCQKDIAIGDFLVALENLGPSRRSKLLKL